MTPEKSKVFLASVVLALAIFPLFTVKVSAYSTYGEWPAQIINIEHQPTYQKLKPEAGEMWFNVSWVVRSEQTRYATHASITVTVYDELGVPIAFGNVSDSYRAGVYSNIFRFTIPTWAYVGQATVYADICSDGVYAPEVSSTFTILRPP